MLYNCSKTEERLTKYAWVCKAPKMQSPVPKSYIPLNLCTVNGSTHRLSLQKLVHSQRMRHGSESRDCLPANTVGYGLESPSVSPVSEGHMGTHGSVKHQMQGPVPKSHIPLYLCPVHGPTHRVSLLRLAHPRGCARGLDLEIAFQLKQ